MIFRNYFSILLFFVVLSISWKVCELHRRYGDRFGSYERFGHYEGYGPRHRNHHRHRHGPPPPPYRLGMRPPPPIIHRPVPIIIPTPVIVRKPVPIITPTLVGPYDGYH
uniref:Leguminosin group485 secreted peptide n=1 Tax=Strongyloides papillosus TaxID=174720 RepID=A0A0N5BMJ9_STREA